MVEKVSCRHGSGVSRYVLKPTGHHSPAKEQSPAAYTNGISRGLQAAKLSPHLPSCNSVDLRATPRYAVRPFPSASTTRYVTSMRAVLFSVLLTPQYFVSDSSTARATAAGSML